MSVVLIVIVAIVIYCAMAACILQFFAKAREWDETYQRLKKGRQKRRRPFYWGAPRI